MIELITGTAGKDHVSSADVGSFNAGIVGEGVHILPRGKRMQCEKVSDNLVKVNDGDLLFKGRHIRIESEDYEELTIENGASGTKRHDLICIHVEKNENTQIETASLVVVKGEFADSPVDPAYTSGTILENDYTIDEYPICRVVLNGLQIESVTMLVEVAKSISELEEAVEGLENSKADYSSVNEAISSINRELDTKAEQTDFEALSARVDNLATLGENATEGNLELLDIRTGADGTVYKSAGEAVRTQISNVEEKIDAHTKTTTDSTLTGSKASSLKIGAIGGKSEQKSYKGLQLLNATSETVTVSGVTCTTNGDGTYTLSGTSTATASNIYIAKSVVLSAGTYKKICFPSGANGWLQLNHSGGAITDNVFTLTEEMTVDVRVGFNSGVTFNNVVIKPMITTDTTATYDDFEPYVGGIASPNPEYPQAVNSSGDSGSITVRSHGKNWLNNTATSGTQYGVNFTVNEDKSVTVNRTSTSEYNAWYTLATNIVLPKGDYILSGSIGGSSSTYRLVLARADGSLLTCNTGETAFTVSTDTETFTRAQIGVIGSASISNVKFYPMIRHATEDNTYEPYTETTFTIPLSEPLRCIDDVKDEIVKQDGVWGILRNITSRDLGSLTWTTYNSTNLSYYSEPIAVGKTLCMCESYRYENVAPADLTDKALKIQASNGRVYLRDTDYSGATSLTNALQGVILYHETAEPTFEPFADEYQSLFYQLESYDGVTYITTDSEVQPEIEVEYAVTDAGAHMLNNYAKSNLAELKVEEVVGMADDATTIANTAKETADTAQSAANNATASLEKKAEYFIEEISDYVIADTTIGTSAKNTKMYALRLSTNNSQHLIKVALNFTYNFSTAVSEFTWTINHTYAKLGVFATAMATCSCGSECVPVCITPYWTRNDNAGNPVYAFKIRRADGESFETSKDYNFIVCLEIL